MTINRITRRTLLRGAGIALALPYLETFSHARVDDPGRAPQRMVAINIPLGFHGPSFFPKEAGSNYQASEYLQPADALRDQFTVISGTSHPEVDGGHSAEKSFLTAAPHPGARSFTNTISLDQHVARRIGDQTRFASLTMGDQSLSWSANGVSVPSMGSPADSFSTLFLRGSADDQLRQRERLQDGQSILDHVLADAHAMQRSVSRADREKLDQYFSAVRETENRLTKAEVWLDTPKPEVNEPGPGEIPKADIAGRLRGNFEVIRLALQTDSTRVIALGGDGGGLVPPLQGVDMGYHSLSHHGMNPQMIEQLKIIERANLAAWVEFIQNLQETSEGSANLLANTQVLLGSNLGSASGHLTTNLPIILAGGRFRHGQHLAFDQRNNYPLANLFVSMMQGLGLEADRFASGTGTMRGLDLRQASQ